MDFNIIVTMDESGARFEGIASTARKKRSQTSRRPKPESQPLAEGRNKSTLLAQQLPDDKAKISSDEKSGYGGSSKRKKVFNLNLCASRDSSVTKDEGEHAHKKLKKDSGSSTLHNNSGLKVDNEKGGGSNQNHHNGGLASSRNSGSLGDAKEGKLKKVKLKVGGVTRTIQTKPTSHATKPTSHSASGNGSSTKSAKTSTAPRPRPKLILQVCCYMIYEKVIV